jgi:hypothetical protein
MDHAVQLAQHRPIDHNRSSRKKDNRRNYRSKWKEAGSKVDGKRQATGQYEDQQEGTGKLPEINPMGVHTLPPY